MRKLILIFSIAFSVFAAENFIISDYDFTNQSYSRSAYRKVFGKYIGEARVDMIYDVARKYALNPLVIFTIAQRESGQFSTPTRKIDDYYLGAWIHYDAARRTNEYKSFSRQTWLSPYRLRYWYDRAAADGYSTKIMDQKDPMISTNAATYALYQYTPLFRYRIGNGYFGNFTFQYIFTDFGRRLGSNEIDKRDGGK